MRILIVTFSLTSGGAERFVVDLSNSLAEKGNEVCVVATDDGNIGANEFYKPDLRPDVRYVNLGGRSGHSVRSLIGLLRFIREYKPDVVHSNSDLIQILLPVLFIHKPRYYHTIHNVAEYYLPNRLWKPFFRYLYARRVQAITISGTCSDTFRNLYGLSNDHVIVNGRNRPLISESHDDVKAQLEHFRGDGRLFIHIARYSPQKNQSVLFDALAKTAGAKLVVLGADYPDDLIRNQDPEKVLYVGLRRNVGDYLSCSDFFILSSLFEGLPLSVLEAMSFGVIPVSTPAGGVVDVIKDGQNGYLADGFDSDALAAAMKRAMSGTISKDTVCAEFENRYSMPSCADKYQHAFENHPAK